MNIDRELDYLLESIIYQEGLLDFKKELKEFKKDWNARKQAKQPKPVKYKQPQIDIEKVKAQMAELNIRDRNSCKNSIFKDLKKELKLYLAKPETKAKINQSKKEIMEYEEKPDFKFVCRYFEADIIEIIDGGQSERIELSWVVDHLVNFIDNKYGNILMYLKMSVSGGDGDEGCIYID